MDSDGPLDETAFYRLVACAPDGPCAKSFYKWNKTTLTVSIVERAPAFLGGKLKRAEASLVRAVQRLNGVGMGLTLTTGEGAAPDIAIHLLDVARGQTISPGTLLKGKTMADAITALEVKGSTITGAAIGFSNTLSIRQYESVMLEEITQALGLITDIQNPYYQTRSILSQNAYNSLKTLGIQDRMALTRHYPP